MRLAILLALLPSVALAQAAPVDAAAAGSPYASFLPIALMLVMMYFLLIRPQQKRAKEHQSLLESLKKGDEVVTSGGMIGRVVKIDGDRATLEIAKGVEVVVIKATISTIAQADNAKPAPASKKIPAVKNDNVVLKKEQIANDN